MALEKENYLPRAAVLRLMKRAGKVRIEKAAVEELQNFLEETGKAAAAKAGDLARFAKRKTITKEDVSLAITE